MNQTKTKSIKVTPAIYAGLVRRMKARETFSQVIERLLQAQIRARG